MNSIFLDTPPQLPAHILIVEDDPAHVEAILRSLASVNWASTEVVGSLRDFRDGSTEHPPSLVLMDFHLPDGKATDVLVQQDEFGEFPIIIMTSHGDEQTVKEVMKNGAFDYLVKTREVFQDLPRILQRSLREWALRRERIALMSETQAIFDLSIDMICIADLNGYLRRTNPAFQCALGYGAEELGNKPFMEFVHPDDRATTLAEFISVAAGGVVTSFQNRLRQKSGGYIWLEWNASLAPHGGIYAFARDITERKKAEQEIHSLAFYDTLTNLPNRRHLIERLKQAQALSVRSQLYGALIYLDMDRFKLLNDILGHDHGDLFLIEVAQRLTNCVCEMDTVARFGGDEFVVLIEEIDSHAEEASQKVALVAEKIRTVLTAPYQLKNHTHFSSPSIGVCLYHDHEESIDSLLKHADLAMYQAKETGGNAVRFFDPDMQLAVETRAALEADMRHAIQENQFHLYYQLQVDDESRAIGAEALIRWIHPVRGMVSPIQFIPIAEESTLILDIGQWVLGTACRQLALWKRRDDTRHLTLAVNVSAPQFKNPDFVDEVLKQVNLHQIDPNNLKLELTEGVVLEDVSKVIAKMYIVDPSFQTVY